MNEIRKVDSDAPIDLNDLNAEPDLEAEVVDLNSR